MQRLCAAQARHWPWPPSARAFPPHLMHRVHNIHPLLNMGAQIIQSEGYSRAWVDVVDGIRLCFVAL